MKFVINGETVELPGGGESAPIGTVISFLGTTAPAGYLVCDGASHNISDYPALAAFFETQFGTKNHFGGDGTATFAVPDMRNLFLRGYHGAAEGALSGDIGAKQEGTSIPYIYGRNESTSIKMISAPYFGPNEPAHQIPRDADSTENTPTDDYPSGTMKVSTTDRAGGIAPAFYTARPVNMAVLYCIKAVEVSGGGGGDSGGGSGGSTDEVYSTEETRIGTWIDGKPLYRKVYTWTGSYALSSSRTYQEIGSIPPVDQFVNCYGTQHVTQPSAIQCVPYADAGAGTSATFDIWGGTINLINKWNTDTTIDKIVAVLEYTKSTD